MDGYSKAVTKLMEIIEGAKRNKEDLLERFEFITYSPGEYHEDIGCSVNVLHDPITGTDIAVSPSDMIDFISLKNKAGLIREVPIVDDEQFASLRRLIQEVARLR